MGKAQHGYPNNLPRKKPTLGVGPEKESAGSLIVRHNRYDPTDP
jgi:hypothetical protein